MPTYEYICRACGHEFERFHAMSAEPVRTCPSCEEPRVDRLISTGGGIVFKGPGFYATDYRKDPPPSSTSKSKSESGSESKDSGKGSGDADSGSKTKKGKGTDE